MDGAAWEPMYRELLRDFGYAREADERARDELAEMMPFHQPADLDALRARFAGREAWIVGAAAKRGADAAADASSARPSDLARIPREAPTIVTDGAAAWAIPLRRPDAIVTDLDGDVGAQAAANALGVPVFVHAHGDNLDALRKHVPAFRGPLAATTQATPVPRVHAFGGFTDGDRAACIAVSLGATSLALVGFDFEVPEPKEGRDPATKRRKLAWARRIIASLGVPWRLV